MDQEAIEYFHPPVKRLCLGSSSSSSEDVVFLSTDSTAELDSSDSAPTYIFPSEDEKQADDDHEVVINTVHAPTSTLAMKPHDLEEKLLKEIAQVLVSKCCSKLCARDLTANSLLFPRRKFNSMGGVAQRQWITDKIHENSHISADGELLTKYIVAGKEVCKMAFCNAYGFSVKRLSKIKKIASLGQVNIQHGNLGRKRSTSKVEEAKVWMNRYFHLIGDKQPDKMKIHLPSWETQHAVYDRYKEDMLKVGIPEEELVGLSTFYRIWRDGFRYVVIPEVSNI